MKVLTRTLLVLLAVPLVLAISARFVSHPSAAPAPASSTTTSTTWDPKPYTTPYKCLVWRHGQCVEAEFSVGSGSGSNDNGSIRLTPGSTVNVSVSMPTRKQHSH